MNHVITPFSRWSNLPALRDMLAKQGVEWHLLVDEHMPIMTDEPWMSFHHLRPPPPGFFIGHWLYNIFLDEFKLEDEDYYNLITDDDFFEPGMFDKIRHEDAPIVITSMNRGKWGVLWATTENVRIGSIGLEQVHIKGWLLKQYRLNGFYESDGFLIEQLWREHRDKFKFVPEAQCYFNYLPPGKAALW